MQYSGDDELYNKLMELVNNDPTKFYIIESQVDAEIQLKYFEYSARLRKEENRTPQELIDDFKDAEDDEIKKEFLIRLALTGNVEAYRFIESYVPEAPRELQPWAMLAYQEARLLLETSLLEESRVFISSGMGGKGHKLRYAVVMISSNKNNLLDFQKDLVAEELKHFFIRKDCELEEIEFNRQFAIITCLIPISIQLQLLFDEIIGEINVMGNFLSETYLITNEKKLNDNDLQKFSDSVAIRESTQE
ncbi:MAG: hypothetical protein KBB11_04940 [Bacteroidales bacterium]|nr:hypothetical protein [Bacteroidales bacterium]HOY38591.1 hypothetical protein [Bacteroidales bacterium]